MLREKSGAQLQKRFYAPAKAMREKLDAIRAGDSGWPENLPFGSTPNACAEKNIRWREAHQGVREKLDAVRRQKTGMAIAHTATAGLKARSAAKIQPQRGRRPFRAKTTSFGALKTPFRAEKTIF